MSIPAVVRRILILVAVPALATRGYAQSGKAKPGDEVHRTVAALDAAVFHAYDTATSRGSGRSSPTTSSPWARRSSVHLWRNKDGAWTITRVISYHHHPRAK